MNLPIYLKRQKKIIDTALDKYLPPAGAYPAVIHRAMRYSVFSGGKRIRPILCIEASKLCGGRSTETMVFACAIELVHTFSLIHDDLPALDNDDFRRGKLTAHKKFNDALAILSGDALLNLAFGLATRGKDYKKQNLIAQELSQAIGTFGMVGGQVADILAEGKTDRGNMAYINYHKTAKFIAAALKIGALSAGVAENTAARAYNYGEQLGLLFQITDDLLDNDGLAKLIGREAARKEAMTLAGKAKDELAFFGKKARVLMAITDLVLNRKK